MDVLYYVRNGPNEELRYSLRSLVNFPHRRVFVVGARQPWFSDKITFIPGNRKTTGQANGIDNMLRGLTHPDISEQVAIFNDDFFITAPVDPAAMFTRCTLAEHIGSLSSRGWWYQSLVKTAGILADEGHDDPLSYELHRPFPCDRDRMVKVLEDCVDDPRPPQWRTLYGNRYAIEAPRDDDGKVYPRRPPTTLHGPYVSTGDASFRGPTGALLRGMWPKAGVHERAGARARR